MYWCADCFRDVDAMVAVRTLQAVILCFFCRQATSVSTSATVVRRLVPEEDKYRNLQPK